MKKFIIATAFILLTGIVFGQALQKGNLVGVHVHDLVLQPDVTYNQWKDFMVNKFIPKVNEAFQGDAKMYLLDGIRGESKNKIGTIFVYKSEEARDKYHNDDESFTELGKKMMEKLNSVVEERGKYDKQSNSKYTDWIVQ